MKETKNFHFRHTLLREPAVEKTVELGKYYTAERHGRVERFYAERLANGKILLRIEPGVQAGERWMPVSKFEKFFHPEA